MYTSSNPDHVATTLDGICTRKRGSATLRNALQQIPMSLIVFPELSASRLMFLDETL